MSNDFARFRAVDINVKAVAATSIQNGYTVYEYRIEAAGALSLNLIFDRFLLTRTGLPLTGTAVVNQPGTYTVTISDDNGCSVSRNIVVTSIGCNP